MTIYESKKPQETEVALLFSSQAKARLCQAEHNSVNNIIKNAGKELSFYSKCHFPLHFLSSSKAKGTFCRLKHMGCVTYSKTNTNAML